MKTSSQLRQDARQSLTNNYGMSVVVTLIQSVITFTVTYLLSFLIIPILLPLAAVLYSNFNESIADSLVDLFSSILSLPTNLIALLVTAPLLYGFSLCFLKLIRTNTIRLEDLFGGFKKAFKKSFIMQLLISIYTFLWSLLFIIPGIIKGIAYSMSYYILIDNPNLTASQAITESERMMNGHKADYFVLQLSFIGWILLSILTCCVGFIFLTPYMETAKAHFYQNLKAQQSMQNFSQIPPQTPPKIMYNV